MAAATNTAHPDLDRISADVGARLRKKWGHGELRRIEPERDKLFLEWADGHESRWYIWNDGELTELHAHNDRKLPLTALLREDRGNRHLRVLSWRPRKRLTLLDNSGAKPRVLKGFRPRRFPAALARYEIAQEALRGSGMRTPEITDVDQALSAIQMVYHAGHRLGLSLESTGLFQTVGKALAMFQDGAAPGPLERFTSDDELAVIDKRHARLAEFAATPGTAWNELRQRLQELNSRPLHPRYGLAHRDLHDKQIVLHGQQLVLLDFDLASQADRALDPANFLAHLVLRRLQGLLGATRRSIDACGERFIDGLAAGATPEFWPRLRFYQATSFCRLALVYRARPPWRHLEPDLITMGHRCLDDLQRKEARP